MGNRIKALLVGQGIRQTEIAAALGITRSTVCGVVNGRKTSHSVQKYIAQKLGKDYANLWGHPEPDRTRKAA